MLQEKLVLLNEVSLCSKLKREARTAQRGFVVQYYVLKHQLPQVEAGPRIQEFHTVR